MKIITEELLHMLCLIIQYKLFSCNTPQETITLYPLIKINKDWDSVESTA